MKPEDYWKLDIPEAFMKFMEHEIRFPNPDILTRKEIMWNFMIELVNLGMEK